MSNLQINTGYVTYTLNDAIEIRINPTDAGFVKKIFKVFETLDIKQDEYKAALSKAKPAEIFDICDRLDTEMREIIDELFGVPVCAALFGDMNVYAMADGLPVWCNLLLAIIDETEVGFAKEEKRMNGRVAKYTAKYHK